MNPKQHQTDEEQNLADNPMSLQLLVSRIAGYFSSIASFRRNHTENKSIYLPQLDASEESKEKKREK